jgi:hypothetical protein
MVDAESDTQLSAEISVDPALHTPESAPLALEKRSKRAQRRLELVQHRIVVCNRQLVNKNLRQLAQQTPEVTKHRSDSTSLVHLKSRIGPLALNSDQRLRGDMQCSTDNAGQNAMA